MEATSFSLGHIELEKLKSIFSKFDFVVASYLFGSGVKQIKKVDSDLDIAILVREDYLKSFDFIQELARLENEIQKIIKDTKLDLVVLNEQSIAFCHNVLVSGYLLYQSNSKERIFFQTSAIKRYCDFQPTLKLIEKYHIQGIKHRLGIA